jgi:hypothetical protein
MNNTPRSDIKYLLVMMVPIALIFILGYIGFSIAFTGANEPHSFWDILYFTLQLFVLQSGAEVPVNNSILQFARFAAPILTLSTFAIIIWILIDYIQKIRLKFFTNHIIVCGLGYLGKEIAYSYSKNRRRVVVIEKDPENSELPLCRSYGITVLIGDATKREVLQTARVEKAGHIYLVTGKDDLNTEIAMKCEEIISDRSNQPVCGHIHLENKDLWQAFHVWNTGRSKSITQSQDKGQFHLDFFNLYQIAGFCILREHLPFTDKQRQEGKAHILVLGLGRMGETLILRMIRAWESTEGKNSKIRITCIDKDITKKNLFEIYYKSLLSKADFSVVDMNLSSSDFLDGKELQSLHKENPITRVYICIDNTSLAITSAMNFIHHGFHDIPIVIRSTYFDGIPKIFELMKKSNSLLENIHTFPIVSSKCCVDMIINGGNILRRQELREIIARVIHEQYLAMRSSQGAIMGTGPELLPWKELSENLKESNRLQADHINVKLDSIGCGITILPDWPEPLFKFSPEEIEKLAEIEHKRFVEEREADGWTLADKKNIEKKESPYLIDYDKLPEEIKEYDRDAVRQIPAILARVGLKVCREVVCQSTDELANNRESE